MVGLLFITHCGIGKEIIKASELILGPLEAVDHISIESLLDSEELMANVREKIKALDKGDGVLIMTDMFGGTPCNISIPFLESEGVEVIAGVCLPMVVAIAKKRGTKPLRELAQEAVSTAKEKIYLVRELLPKEGESGAHSTG